MRSYSSCNYNLDDPRNSKPCTSKTEKNYENREISKQNHKRKYHFRDLDEENYKEDFDKKEIIIHVSSDKKNKNEKDIDRKTKEKHKRKHSRSRSKHKSKRSRSRSKHKSKRSRSRSKHKAKRSRSRSKHKSKRSSSRSKHKSKRSRSRTKHCKSDTINELNSNSTQTKKKKSKKLSDEELLEYLRQRRQNIMQSFANDETNDELSNLQSGEIEKENSENMSTVETKEISPTEISGSSSNNDNKFVCENDMFGDNYEIETVDKKIDVSNHVNPDSNADKEGYSLIKISEILDKRYFVYNYSGKGMFGKVFRARDLLNENQEVAIKVIRNNEMMYHSGLKEIQFLEKLKELDIKDKYHCIRFLRTFMNKGHLCMVFECLDMDMRGLLYKYGKNIGLHISALKVYAYQLIKALILIKRADIIHGDIKPDNILINKDRNIIKLADFGSASLSEDCNITEYFVSRFYRAPEIILGLKYDYKVDTWAVGCTLFELYTGKVLFPGANNNEMIKLIMDAKGRFPKKMLNGLFRDKHFDEKSNLIFRKWDTILNLSSVKVINPMQTKSLDLNLFHNASSYHQNINEIKQFRDLIDRMIQPNPVNRIQPEDALKHPFFKNPEK